jgi:hypothetical protein
VKLLALNGVGNYTGIFLKFMHHFNPNNRAVWLLALLISNLELEKYKNWMSIFLPFLILVIVCNDETFVLYQFCHWKREIWDNNKLTCE